MTTIEIEEKATVSYYSPIKKEKTTATEKIIIIGAGPAGIRCAHEILKQIPHSDIHVFSNEPYQPYNRVQLSSLLAGETSFDEIINRLPNPNTHKGIRLTISTITHIDKENKRVTCG